jgi:hypothetical protein
VRDIVPKDPFKKQKYSSRILLVFNYNKKPDRSDPYCERYQNDYPDAHIIYIDHDKDFDKYGHFCSFDDPKFAPLKAADSRAKIKILGHGGGVPGRGIIRSDDVYKSNTLLGKLGWKESRDFTVEQVSSILKLIEHPSVRYVPKFESEKRPLLKISLITCMGGHSAYFSNGKKLEERSTAEQLAHKLYSADTPFLCTVSAAKTLIGYGTATDGKKLYIYGSSIAYVYTLLREKFRKSIVGIPLIFPLDILFLLSKIITIPVTFIEARIHKSRNSESSKLRKTLFIPENESKNATQISVKEVSPSSSIMLKMLGKDKSSDDKYMLLPESKSPKNKDQSYSLPVKFKPPPPSSSRESKSTIENVKEFIRLIL